MTKWAVYDSHTRSFGKWIVTVVPLTSVLSLSKPPSWASAIFLVSSKVHEMRNRTTTDKEQSPIFIPWSSVAGIGWPAVPRQFEARVLALQYQLDQSQWWEAEALQQLQLRQMEMLLVHAERTVPFYRGRFKALAGLKRVTMEAWRKIPTLLRTDIQDHGQDLVSRKMPEGHGRIREIRSSGSTGRPISVKTTDVTQLFFAALNLRYHLWRSRDFRGKTARIIRPISSKSQIKPQGWVPGYNSGPMVSLGVTSTVAEQVAWLREEDPHYLFTYPSNLRAILDHCQNNGVELSNLRGIATMGEVVEDTLRAACEEVLGLSLSDCYSAQEVGMIALQCPDHPHYHVQSERIFLEILNNDGTPCGPGETGRVVLTDLHNFAMPLIRYEIGDYGEFGEPCSCGRGLPVLSRILGRQRNMLTLPSGDLIWPLFDSNNLDQYGPVGQAQLVQRTTEELELRMVVNKALKPRDEKCLRKAVLDRLGHPFTLNLVCVDEIPRLANGKFEDFMSEVK